MCGEVIAEVFLLDFRILQSCIVRVLTLTWLARGLYGSICCFSDTTASLEGPAPGVLAWFGMSDVYCEGMKILVSYPYSCSLASNFCRNYGAPRRVNVHVIPKSLLILQHTLPSSRGVHMRPLAHLHHKSD